MMIFIMMMRIMIFKGSFLEEGFDEHMKEVWGLNGFDIIMGNPPYNYNELHIN